jgi:hypothetical protein
MLMKEKNSRSLEADEVSRITDETSLQLFGGVNMSCDPACSNQGCTNASCSRDYHPNNNACTNTDCLTNSMSNESCSNTSCIN